MTRTALITGVTGQDGSYLTELLLSDDYRVVGTTRDPQSQSAKNLRQFLSSQFSSETISQRFEFQTLNLQNQEQIANLLQQIRPDEVYHLAGQSRVGKSFSHSEETFEANAMSTLHLLEAIRNCDALSIRFFLAGSGEIFGGVHVSPQSEETDYAPRSPYARSKLSAQLLVESFREAYGMFACTGILFNHESPRRSVDFVTGKIAQGVAKIAKGEQQKLVLGNLDTGRDWGFAGEYVQAMQLMLKSDVPQDFIIATGQWHSLQQFLAAAFQVVGLDWTQYTTSDPALFRPSDPTQLVGDPTQIKQQLGWTPTTTFEQLVAMMVRVQLEALRLRQ